MRARLKVSRAGVELIKSFEGLRQTAARLPDGRWTLGYGHTFSARDGAKVTPEDAEALLRFDLLPIVDGLNNNIVVPLSQHQFDALVSFCFNIGLENFVSSNVLKRINEGRLMEAALAMESWRSAEFGGQTYVLAPLIRRRAAEKNLFLTPVETDNTAPSMLVRPMEDPRLGEGNPSSRPAELDAPLYGDHLQARPLGEPEIRSPYAAQPSYEAPVQAAPVAPVVPSYGSDRTYIDLSAAPVAPQAEVRAKPVIVRMADLGPETSSPVAAPAVAPGFNPTVFSPATLSPDGEPVMSPAVRAALEQAQAEADARDRAEAQCRADELRLSEETRLRETRLAEEAQRQAQALAAARAEQEARQAAFKIEEDRRREEEERQRTARLEEEKARQAQAEEALRLEAQRQEDQRRETEARLQAEAQKQAELAAAAAAVVVAPVILDAPSEKPVETKAAEAPKPVEAPASNGADDTKRNEAMANLMRFYSPYGASPMGKPLGSLRPTQAPAAPATPAPVTSAPPATQATPSTLVAPPSSAQSTPTTPVTAPAPSAAATPVYPAYPSKPDNSVSPTPGLVIDTQEPTILSPSALVPPAVFAATPQSSARPVETSLEIGRSNPARQAAAEAQVNWRDKLDRPVPGEFPKPVAPSVTPTPTAPYHSPSKVYDATVSDDDELWDDDAARIAMMADHDEDDHPSFMTMISSSIGWLVTSTLGIIALGGAAAAFYKSNDSEVVRAGDDWSDFFQHSAIILAVIGLVLICSSIAMILKRLGGLKD